MKKVVLIGKLNEITKQINDALSPFCRVQLCADDVDITAGMLKMVPPDLVIVSLVGLRSAYADIFSMLSRELRGRAFIVVGSKADEDALTDQGFLSGNVHFLRRPIRLEDICTRVKELLGLTEGEGQANRILLVDDDPAMLRIVQSMLAEKYKVTFATSGPKAIAAVAKSRPDLILLDYDMPICDGRMTFEMLRSEEDTDDIPVIFLTGMSNLSNVQNVLALHPEGYLLKPPDREMLLERIDQVLALRRAKHSAPVKGHA